MSLHVYYFNFFSKAIHGVPQQQQIAYHPHPHQNGVPQTAASPVNMGHYYQPIYAHPSQLSQVMQQGGQSDANTPR